MYIGIYRHCCRVSQNMTDKPCAALVAHTHAHTCSRWTKVFYLFFILNFFFPRSFCLLVNAISHLRPVCRRYFRVRKVPDSIYVRAPKPAATQLQYYSRFKNCSPVTNRQTNKKKMYYDDRNNRFFLLFISFLVRGTHTR